jgi:hypothetical protein
LPGLGQKNGASLKISDGSDGFYLKKLNSISQHIKPFESVVV